MPPLNFFVNKNKPQEEIDEIKNWWLEKKNSKWTFNEEIINYCDNDVNILRQASLYFIQETVEFERKLQRKYPHVLDNCNPTYHKNFMDPFAHPVNFLIFIFTIFSHLFRQKIFYFLFL